MNTRWETHSHGADKNEKPSSRKMLHIRHCPSHHDICVYDRDVQPLESFVPSFLSASSKILRLVENKLSILWQAYCNLYIYYQYTFFNSFKCNLYYNQTQFMGHPSVALHSKRGKRLTAVPLWNGKTVLSTDLVPRGFGATVSCELELSQSALCISCHFSFLLCHYSVLTVVMGILNIWNNIDIYIYIYINIYIYLWTFEPFYMYFIWAGVSLFPKLVLHWEFPLHCWTPQHGTVLPWCPKQDFWSTSTKKHMEMHPDQQDFHSDGTGNWIEYYFCTHPQLCVITDFILRLEIVPKSGKKA